ncbi:hypothetical protein LLEC1_01013 [Akanthomyces lecanii]|uniref:Uncharacterized protein n=1 Tax=Cordyceps confragosa TaxID=2714763 RepID=A0A179ICA4_CORDF|nr:hypothetical protein LLEC1_01013 [Akanthomyces lecanii]
MDIALRRAATRAKPIICGRLLHGSAVSAYAYKDAQKRDSLKPHSTEHTISGRDDDVAALDTAFASTKKNAPEAELHDSTDGSGGSPLELSGANTDLSRPPKEGGKTTGQKNETKGGSKDQRKGRK